MYNNGQESEIETLQNALQEAMLRERQLIQEKAQREDEMKQQRDASKQYIGVLMKEKEELMKKMEAMDGQGLQAEAEQSKQDLQRVLLKLSQREHEHNLLNEQIMKLRTAAQAKDEIEKNYRIAKDKLETMQQKIEKANKDSEHFHETQTLLQSMIVELKETKQKNKIIENEKENLKDELRYKTEEVHQLNLKVEQISAQSVKYNESIHELSAKLEDITTKGKEQIEELLAQKQADETQINELQHNLEQMTKERETERQEYEQTMDEMEEKLNEQRVKHEAIQTELEREMEERKEQIRELEMASKIKEKKKNKLLKELQEQLKKEVIKSQELKCTVLKLNDELATKSQDSNSSSISNATSFVEQEVTGALAKKLEFEVQSNFSLKEKIKYLTESIQQLHIELDNKKTVIANLTKRIDLGALPSTKHAIDKNIRTNRNHSNPQRELLQLQLLMQETTLQNDMLRKDLKLMANALQESNDKIKTLSGQTTD